MKKYYKNYAINKMCKNINLDKKTFDNLNEKLKNYK